MTRIFDKTKNISPFFRRLDTIARFLEVDQTCTATSLISGKLYISSNKLEYSLSQTPGKIESLNKGVNLLSNFDSKNKNQNIQIAYNRFYGSNIEELSKKGTLAYWCMCVEDNKKYEAK
jgi:hypothetical protein